MVEVTFLNLFQGHTSTAVSHDIPTDTPWPEAVYLQIAMTGVISRGGLLPSGSGTFQKHLTSHYLQQNTEKYWRNLGLLIHRAKCLQGRLFPAHLRWLPLSSPNQVDCNWPVTRSGTPTREWMFVWWIQYYVLPHGTDFTWLDKLINAATCLA